MTFKETQESNAREIARALKGKPTTELVGRMIEGAVIREPGSGTTSPPGDAVVDGEATVVEPAGAARPATGGAKFGDELKKAMGLAPTEEQTDLARDASIAFLASLPPPIEKIEVSVAMLRESPSNPRKTFAGLEKLGQSMLKLGCLQAIIVRPHPDGGYETVEGHRRVRAAALVGIATLPAEVRSLTDAQVMEVQLTANLQRQGLSPLEEAEGYEWLHSRGWSVDQIVEKLGGTRATVYGRMKLLDLSASCRKALADDKIPLSVAAPLARCGRHVDQEKALKQILARADDEGKINAREAVEWLQKEFTRSMKSPPFSVRDEMLVADTPACTKCPKRTINMPRELFDGKVADTCTDVPCFVAKSRANFEQKAQELAADKGALIMSIEEGASLFRFETLGPDSNLVELDTPNTSDPQRRSWGTLLEKLPEEKRPQLVVAPDRNLMPRVLIDRKEITKALADETNMKWAVEQSTKPARKTKEEAAEAREEKREAKARAAAALIAAQKIATAAARGGVSAAEWGVLFEVIAGSSSFRPEVMEALKVKSFAELDKQMKRASLPEIIAATLLIALVDSGHLDADDGYSDELKVLARARAVDLSAIEKACSAMTPAEEKPKGKSRK